MLNKLGEFVAACMDKLYAAQYDRVDQYAAQYEKGFINYQSLTCLCHYIETNMYNIDLTLCITAKRLILAWYSVSLNDRYLETLVVKFCYHIALSIYD